MGGGSGPPVPPLDPPMLVMFLIYCSHYTVNACLFPLCATHGLAITTVEGVGNPETGLHAVQVCHRILGKLFFAYEIVTIQGWKFVSKSTCPTGRVP